MATWSLGSCTEMQRWAVRALVAAVMWTHASSAQDMCELVHKPDFNAYWAGEVMAASMMGNFKLLDAAQHSWTMEGVTAECITNPTFFVVVSAIWRPPDDEGGRRVAERMVATARRLVSEQTRPTVWPAPSQRLVRGS